MLGDENEGSKDGSHFIYHLEGNKNENGQTLGSESQNTADSYVHISKPFKGNKNKKMGTNWACTHIQMIMIIVLSRASILLKY